MSQPNSPGSRRWQGLVAKGAAELGVTVTGSQVARLACHANELIKWNRKINLTRISDPAEMAIKHYVDSLACVPYIPDGGDILDIGSGGGFPGIPVAVAARPGSLLMIDSVGKKASFLQQVLRLMGLENVEARHVRAQELKEEAGYGAYFDRVICRALTGVEQIVELAFPLLKAGGMVVALKGRVDRVDAECRRLAGSDGKFPGADDIRRVAYRLPVLDVERSLLLIRKQETFTQLSGPGRHRSR